MQFANSSLGDYLELLKILRNEIFIRLFETNNEMPQVIKKCLEMRSLLRIKCHKSFYPIEGCAQWNVTLFPFTDDSICIEISQMNITGKRALKKLIEYASCEGFSIQRNGGDYAVFEGFKYDLITTQMFKGGLLLFLFIDHMESNLLEDELMKGSSLIKSIVHFPYESNSAKTRLKERFGI